MFPARRFISCFANHYLQHFQEATRSTATLAYETVVVGAKDGASSSSDAQPLEGILLHGLLGSGRNWRSFARRLATSVSDATSREVQVHLLDLRNHGSSSRIPGIHPPHTMETAAQDIVHLIQQALSGRTPQLMIGHSLGGKVLLELIDQLQQSNLELPKQAWVLDSQPGKVSIDFDQPSGVARVINTISSIPLPVPSRPWLYDHLKQHKFSLGISHWMGSNLVQDPNTGNLVWAFNIQGAAAMYNSYRANDYHPLLASPPQGLDLHLVRGEKSDRWNASMLQQLQGCEQASSSKFSSGGGGRFQVHVLARAGHWLHTENPDGLHALLHQHVVKL